QALHNYLIMNILPKKRWHVRTKENMARVRRDVKKAEEEEQAILDREILATNEARLSALRKNADMRRDSMFGVIKKLDEGCEFEPTSSGGHINFFEELEKEEAKHVGDTNKDYEEEKKKETREWEATMGIQIKLGDDGNEGKGYWFDKIPLRRGIKEMKMIEEEKKNLEKNAKLKTMVKEKRKRNKRAESDDTSNDDMETRSDEKEKMKKDKKKKKKRKEKTKKRRKSSSDSEDEDEMMRRDDIEKKERLEKLRDERIRRERLEKAKTQMILHPELKKTVAEKNAPKYNSMFNPHLAK
ncbi:hypothetical protein PMAYCL1PPCAC_23916, partial [Pristionchus mayeri]